MAAPPCTMCDNEMAMIVATIIDTGDVEFVGAQCLPGYALAMAAQMTTGMTAEACEAYGEQFDAISANDQRQASRSASGAGKRSRKTQSAPSADSASSAAGSESSEGASQPKPSNDGEPVSMRGTKEPSAITCPNCGGASTTPHGDTIVVCDICGTEIELPVITG